MFLHMYFMLRNEKLLKKTCFQNTFHLCGHSVFFTKKHMVVSERLMGPILTASMVLHDLEHVSKTNKSDWIFTDNLNQIKNHLQDFDQNVAYGDGFAAKLLHLIKKTYPTYYVPIDCVFALLFESFDGQPFFYTDERVYNAKM